MTTVTGALRRPDGAPAAGHVIYQVVGAGGRPLTTAFLVDETIVGTSTAQLAQDGTYSIDVPANSLIVPAGTRWARTHVYANGNASKPILLEVPEAGPVSEEDIPADPPGALASAALEQHIADSDPHPAAQPVVRRWAQALGQLGAVVFVWDDGWASNLAAAAINEARGQQVTFAITTGLVGTANHLTEAQVLDLHNRGHEIAAHGVQHTTGLPSLSAAVRATEYADCLDWFEPRGIPRPSTWVYTFGGAPGRSDDTDRELWGRVDRVLDTIGSFTPAAAMRRDQFGFVMKRQQAESDSSGALARAENLIRLAAQTPTVVAFYMHDLDAGANSLTTAEYTALCDLCVDLGIPVVTARDALPRNQLLVDPGFEAANALGLWDTQVTGASTATVETDTPVVGLPGTKSLKLHGVDGGTFAFAMVLQYVPIQPGRVYTLSGRYRTAAGAGTAGKIRFGSYDHKGTIIGTATTVNLAEATSWTRFEQDFTANANGVIAQVALLNDPATDQTTDVWFDHLCLLPKAGGAFG